jgi:prevent-host-death family protein
MTSKRMKSRELRDRLREILRYVEDGGQVVVEHYNRPVARIVPIEETAMPNPIPTEAERAAALASYEMHNDLAREHSTRVAAHVRAYLRNPADLTGHPWCPRGWPGNAADSTQDELTDALHQLTYTETLLEADKRGREYDDPTVLADLDMDELWRRACAGYITDRREEKVVELQDELRSVLDEIGHIAHYGTGADVTEGDADRLRSEIAEYTALWNAAARDAERGTA